MAGLIFAGVVVLVAVFLLRRWQGIRSGRTGTGGRYEKAGRIAKAPSASPGSQGAGRAGALDRRSRRYAAVEIRRGRNACAAVGEFRNRVILASDAPALPVAGCDSPQCECRYEFLADRRQEDRRTPYGVEHGMVIGDAALDKRRGRDRRAAEA